jgi:hypothetical protein
MASHVCSLNYRPKRSAGGKGKAYGVLFGRRTAELCD